jgi:hypothetical protein
MACEPFFLCAGAVRVHLDAGAIEGDDLQLECDQTLLLQAGEHPILDSVFAPAVHAGIDGMPFAEVLRQSAPFAPFSIT